MDKYIVVVGSMNFDVIFLQDRMPYLGETYLARKGAFASGGKGANQAVQICRLGTKTYMVAKVGCDVFGDYLKGELERYGVDTTYVTRGDGTTGLGGVHTMPDGVYYSTVAPGTNMELTCEEIEELEGLIKGAAVVVLQLEIPVEVTARVLDMAHSNGVYSVLNAAPACALPGELLKQVDCLIVNEVEAAYYLGHSLEKGEVSEEDVRKLLDKVCQSVIITLGDKGSVLGNSGGITVYRTDPSIEAVETTGSGDSYVGAFAFMKAKGASDEDACRFASLVSQYTVTRVGGQPSMPRYEEIEGAWETARRAR